MSNSEIRRSELCEKPSAGFYEFLENEIRFERERKQEVFSWASSLLVAIIGGVVALTTGGSHAVLADRHKWFLSATIVVLCACSWYWIEIHWAAYLRARKKLSFYFDQLAARGEDRYWPHDYTGLLAVLLLSLTALVAVWWTIPFSSVH